MVGWIADFFNPKQQGQQTKQLPPLAQTSMLFGGQQAKQQGQQAKQLDQQQTNEVLADAIADRVKQQAQQSRQQLHQLRRQQATKAVVADAEQAHAQVLDYARQARALLAEIKEASGQVGVRRQQAQQGRRLLKKREAEAAEVVGKLRAVLGQMMAKRQQGQRAQASHLRQLRQIRQDLIDQVAAAQPNKKVVQYDTQDGNKVRVQLSLHPDAKCCVAQSLGQKTRFLSRGV